MLHNRTNYLISLFINFNGFNNYLLFIIVIMATESCSEVYKSYNYKPSESLGWSMSNEHENHFVNKYLVYNKADSMSKDTLYIEVYAQKLNHKPLFSGLPIIPFFPTFYFVNLKKVTLTFGIRLISRKADLVNLDTSAIKFIINKNIILEHSKIISNVNNRLPIDISYCDNEYKITIEKSYLPKEIYMDLNQIKLPNLIPIVFKRNCLVEYVPWVSIPRMN